MLSGVQAELNLAQGDEDFQFLDDLKQWGADQAKPMILFEHDPELMKLSISSFDENRVIN